MKEKLFDFLNWSIATDMGDKKPVSHSNVRSNKNFVNLHGIAAIKLPDMKDYVLYHDENGNCFAIPLTYDKQPVERTITCDEHVTV